MQIHALHSWDVSPTEAIALQKKLATRVDAQTPLEKCDLVAGADVSYARGSDLFHAAVVVLRASDCQIVEVQRAQARSPFPYVPGLLSFREAPILLQAFARVESKVDAVLYDGHGVAHMRRLGIAAHLGLCLEVPCIGCAKSLLLGVYEEPGMERGATSPLTHKGEVIGQVVRTKKKVKPVYVSPGHRIDLASSVRLTLDMCRGYRLPETTRLAHQHVNVFRREQDG
jgi:deoxyribonuclease V